MCVRCAGFSKRTVPSDVAGDGKMIIRGQGQDSSQKMAQLAAEAAARCQPICIEQWLLPCSILQSLTSAEHQLI